MQRTTLTTNCFTAILVFTGLFSSFMVNANSHTQDEFSGSHIAKQCPSIRLHLEHWSSTPNDLRLNKPKSDFAGYIYELEQQLIPAYNLLFESYLYADVSTKLEVRTQAKLCQLKLSEAINNVLGSENTSAILKAASSLANSDREHRVLERYLDKHKTYANKTFADNNLKLKSVGLTFREGTATEVNQPFKLTSKCLKGLPKKLKSSFNLDGFSQKPISKKQYVSLLKQHPESTCRQAIYQQYQGRHEVTNAQYLHSYIALRNQGAKHLGFEHFAQYSLLQTQLKTVENTHSLLEKLVNKLEPTPAPWDYRFEKLQQKRQAVNGQKKLTHSSNKSISPQKAHQGLFKLLHTEFGLTVTQQKKTTWHSSVGVYQLKQNGVLLGEFYLDLYARDGKYKKNRHRAIRRGVEGIQLPSSALILNLPKKRWKQKQLKSFFHEFGHLLHNMLSTQPYHVIAGISIEKDLIEMPAKWFEWLSFEPDIQQKIFGEVIVSDQGASQGTPYKLRLYRASMALAYFSQLTNVNADALEKINAKLFNQYVGYDYPDGSSSQYSFSHLATYGPRYYSYIYSELVARKLLQDFKKGTFKGTDFLNKVLAKGGSQNMTEMLGQLYQTPLTINQIINWVSK